MDISQYPFCYINISICKFIFQNKKQPPFANVLRLQINKAISIHKFKYQNQAQI